MESLDPSIMRRVGVKISVIEHHEESLDWQREAVNGMENAPPVLELDLWGSPPATMRNPCTLSDFNC